MTQDAKGRGDAAPPAKPAPLFELGRRWPLYAKRYAKPLAMLEKAELPAGTDRLRLAQKMIEVCENCRGGLPDHVDMARAIDEDAKSATHAARDLARFLRRYWKFPRLSAELEEAGRKARLFLAKRESGLVSETDDGLAFLPIAYAAMLEHLAQRLPRLPTTGTAHRKRDGIYYGASLLRKGRPTVPMTACIFGLVFNARQATGPARDAWANQDRAAIAGPMPEHGSPLYKIAAAFARAAFEKEIDETQAADRLAKFLKRNPAAEFTGFRVMIAWPD